MHHLLQTFVEENFGGFSIFWMEIIDKIKPKAWSTPSFNYTLFALSFSPQVVCIGFEGLETLDFNFSVNICYRTCKAPSNFTKHAHICFTLLMHNVS